MPYHATVYNVMIASPGDVGAERNAVRQVLAEWNAIHSQSREIVLLPVGWETHSSPEMGGRPQTILNRQILGRSDLLIAMFWTRLGTPTADHPSGSVAEIAEHVAAGKPAMIYFSTQPVRLESVDSEEYDRLVQFKSLCRERGLYQEYDDVADFRDKCSRQLQLRLNQDAYFKGEESGFATPIVDLGHARPAERSLSDDAKLLLATAAESNGVVMRISSMGGTQVSAGTTNFIEANDRRLIARWEAAVDELERERLVEDKAGKREVYLVTNDGYRLADSLPKGG